MSLEIKPLAAFHPPPLIYIFRGANAVGMSITPPATTENGDRELCSSSQPYKAHFCMGGGYNAARGIGTLPIVVLCYNYLS